MKGEKAIIRRHGGGGGGGVNTGGWSSELLDMVVTDTEEGWVIGRGGWEKQEDTRLGRSLEDVGDGVGIIKLSLCDCFT